jgi:hypothetical protein
MADAIHIKCERNPCKSVVQKPGLKRTLWSSGRKRGNNITIDIKSGGAAKPKLMSFRICMAQVIAKSATNFQIPHKTGNLTSCVTVRFSRRLGRSKLKHVDLIRMDAFQIRKSHLVQQIKWTQICLDINIRHHNCISQRLLYSFYDF